MTKRILVLGGCGFIGRNLVKYLVENNHATKIRVVDKKIPEMVGLSKTYSGAFDKVEFVQANLVNPDAISSVFDDPSGSYNIVFNVAAETKLSLEPEAYKEGIVDLTVRCATEAAKRKVERFVHVSTAVVYEASNKPKDEKGKLDPWTSIAKASLQAEEELKKIAGLNYVIARPAIIYGPADVSGLGPRIVIAAIYKKIGKPMKLLWGGQLKLHTVHIDDVVHALWFLVTNGEVGQVFNLADKNDTDQQKLNTLWESIFGIKTGFKSKLTSQIATKLAMSAVAEEVNSRHIDPWAAICKENGIGYSRLTPYLDEEYLYNNDHSVDGSAIEKLGFSYQHPQVTEQAIREVINEYVVAEWFPKNYI